MKTGPERVLRGGICILLLIGPATIAFFSGGISDGPRDFGAVAAWLSVAGAAVMFSPAPVPGGRGGRMALGGLAGLALLVSLSAYWAPLKGPALDDRVRLALYLGTFLLAATAWESRKAARLAEPFLAVGAMVVISYGLSERVLPDLVSFERPFGTDALIRQPISYWNAMGVLAAIGLVLAARAAGDTERAPLLRSAAAATWAPFGAGMILSASRGAIAALAVGLAVLVVLAPERRQARAAVLALGAGSIGALAAGLLPAVRTLEGGVAERRLQGLVLLVVMGATGVASALVERRLATVGSRSGLPRPRRALAPLAALALAAVLLPAVAGGDGRGLGGNRDDYWAVAVGVFAEQPLWGAGSGAFVAEWARERQIEESVRDAHSLPLETAAELGLPGLAALGLLFAGVGLAAHGAYRRDRALAAGPCAVVILFAVHATVDWDWEVPAVVLPVLVAAGVLVWGDEPTYAPRAD